VADIQQSPETPDIIAPDPDPIIEVPLFSKRRERGMLLQKLQHAIPAIPLLGAGIQRLMHGEQGFALALAVGEILMSVLLLRTIAKELAALRRPAQEHTAHHGGVDWFHIFAAGMLTVEVLEHWHTRHHLPRPMILTAIFSLALGLLHGRFAAFSKSRRSLRIDAAGIRFGGRFIFHQHFIPWTNLESIDLDDREARLVVRDGRQRRINLKDLRNASEVRQALLAARARLKT
jgi:hypothetical protein